MKKKLLYIALVLSVLLLNSCKIGDIKIEKNPQLNNTSKNSESEPDSEGTGFNADISDSDSLIEEITEPEISSKVELGERFYAKTLVKNAGEGVIYATVNKAEVFYNLKDAGFKLEDAFPYSIYDGLHYDAASDTFTKDGFLVKLYFTIENINATSGVDVYEPGYDKYDFRIDGFGGCTMGPIVYYNKANERSVHYFAFNLKPGETIDIEAFYLVRPGLPLDEITFNCGDTYTEYSTIDTTVILNLE